MIKTQDGTYTLYSTKYDEHYHSLQDGALKESLYKHVIPAIDNIEKEELNILDICFGLGYNTLATLLFTKKKVKIFSPELDLDLVKSLKHFSYPKEFEIFQEIINLISDNLFYQNEFCQIEVFNIDAINFLENTNLTFDIVYQDPFSIKKNPTLWSEEYFKLIKTKMGKILTTYSKSKIVRDTLIKSGFYLYQHSNQEIRSGTIATLEKLNNPLHLIEI